MTREIATTTGQIKDGVLRIRHRTRFAANFARMKDCEVVIKVERMSATRSLNQNAWYWACVVGLVSEHTGYTPNEVHEIYKAKFLPKRLAVCDGNGEVKGEFVIGGTTTTLDKNEFSQFCEDIRIWAATELGVAIPDPNIY